MPTYFKPLRRKIGVVTLALACVFTCGWMSSFRYYDRIIFPIRDELRYALTSYHGCLHWERDDDRRGIKSGKIFWKRYPVLRDAAFMLDFPDLKWRSRFLGIGVKQLDSPDLQIRIVVIPYWSIVIPLTLLSAWLLLSKPRAKKALEKQD